MDLSGVSFLSGFAAGVGIGLFVSCFDAACEKKQQADVNIDERFGGVAVKNDWANWLVLNDWANWLVFAVKVLPGDGAEGVFSEVSDGSARAEEAYACGDKDAGVYKALGALLVAGQQAAGEAFGGKGAQRFALLVCEGLEGAVCAGGCGVLSKLFREYVYEPVSEVYGKVEGAYSEDDPCRCLVVVCDVSQSELGEVLLGCEEEDGAKGAKQPFVLWRDDELKKFLDKDKPGYVHGDSVTVLG